VEWLVKNSFLLNSFVWLVVGLFVHIPVLIAETPFERIIEPDHSWQLLSLFSPVAPKGNSIEKLVHDEKSDHWQNGYTLIITQDTNIASVNRTRDYIISRGGRVAIVFQAHIILGWIPPNLAANLIGKNALKT
jgi:hypothetical protein